MLQLPETKRPNVAPKARATAAHPKKSALSIIRADIQPIGDDPNLLNELCYMSERNDIDGMVALYDAYSSAANGFLLIQNQPRTSGMANDFIELERCQMWSKAYLVADFLKDLHPDKYQAERYARVLFDCAFQMGSNLTEVAAIVQEIAAMRPDDKSKPQQRSQRSLRKSSRLSDIVDSFEATLKRYYELDASGAGTNQEFNEIGDRIGDLINEASYLPAETETEAAFLIMLAYSASDLTINGRSARSKKLALERLERHLIGVMAHVSSGLENLPNSRSFMWPENRSETPQS